MMVWLYIALVLAGTVMGVSMVIRAQFWSEAWGPVLWQRRLPTGWVRFMGVVSVAAFTMPVWGVFVIN